MNIFDGVKKSSFNNRAKGKLYQVCDDSSYTLYYINGMTFVKQSTGGWKANGTLTAPNDLPVGTGRITAGHKYLFTGSNQYLTTNGFMRFYGGGCDIVETGGQGSFQTATATTTGSYRWYASSGTFTDTMFYPQIFDLTATYGAGKEPTTLAQFRADYPDAYYPYNL